MKYIHLADKALPFDLRKEINFLVKQNPFRGDLLFLLFFWI